MKQFRHHMMFATAMALVLAVSGGVVRAEESATVKTNPGFNPSTGQINPGGQAQAPSSSAQVIRIPSAEEALAAFREPVSTQPSLGSEPVKPIPAAEAPQHASSDKQTESKNVAGGPQGSGANSNNPQWGQEAIEGRGAPASTVGSGNTQQTQDQAQDQAQAQAQAQAQRGAQGEPSPSGPIGAIGQTMPSKFSKRNEVLDRVPIMAFPSSLSDEDRKKIYDAVMADKSPAANGADGLTPASALSTEQALNGMHPLPEALSGIAQVKGYHYVKAKDKVLLVEPASRVVVDQIKS